MMPAAKQLVLRQDGNPRSRSLPMRVSRAEKRSLSLAVLPPDIDRPKTRG